MSLHELQTLVHRAELYEYYEGNSASTIMGDLILSVDGFDYSVITILNKMAQRLTAAELGVSSHTSDGHIKASTGIPQMVEERIMGLETAQQHRMPTEVELNTLDSRITNLEEKVKTVEKEYTTLLSTNVGFVTTIKKVEDINLEVAKLKVICGVNKKRKIKVRGKNNKKLHDSEHSIDKKDIDK